MVVMVVACGLRIEIQCARYEPFHLFVGIAGDSRVDFDTHAAEHLAGSAPYASAYQFLDPRGFQIPCEGPMSQAVVADDLGSDDLPVLDFIDLELLRMAEVLEDLPVLISCSYLHSIL